MQKCLFTAFSHDKLWQFKFYRTAITLNHNVIDVLIGEHPRLTRSNILLLSVSSLRFSIAEICVYLDMTIDTTYVKRSKLLKELGTTLPTIEAFLEDKINHILDQNSHLYVDRKQG